MMILHYQTIIDDVILSDYPIVVFQSLCLNRCTCIHIYIYIYKILCRTTCLNRCVSLSGCDNFHYQSIHIIVVIRHVLADVPSMCQKRPSMCQKRPSMCQKRPSMCQKIRHVLAGVHLEYNNAVRV